MDLKPHQDGVLADLRAFLSHLNGGGIASAFRTHWLAKHAGGMPAYGNTLPGVPHVCIKVPTGGGKTLIAAAALQPLFAWACPDSRLRPRVVVWLAPSLTIVEQTLRALQDPAHPYRRRLAQDFSGRIAVHDKESLLQGAGLAPDALREQLTVVVLSYDSLRTANKDNRRLHTENGRLLAFAGFPEVDMGDKGAPSVIDLLRACAPVVVVDESQNATSKLSREMLADLGPSFVLDLTATPRKDANIISFVSALALRDAGMVKLPVIVRNRPDKETVYQDAIDLQRRLEAEANAEEARCGRYLRPIVLFQAESKIGIETHQRVRKTLEQMGIAANQIAIKTAELDEIRGRDLLARDCPIRFIITVNALKEGWDCPFAYVLASLADRQSPVEVEQILGRILRQPQARPFASRLLNCSYVLTASAQFHRTLGNIVDGLKHAGFSEHDYRVIEEEAAPSPQADETLFKRTPPPSTQSANADDDWADAAARQSEEFEHLAAASRDQNLQAPEVEAAMNRKSMRAALREAATALHLPQFFLTIPPIGFLPDSTEVLLERENLLRDFRLLTCSSAISFESLEDPIIEVDVEESGRPSVRTLDSRREQQVAALIHGLSRESQIQQMAVRLYQLIGRMPPIADQDIRKYIMRILEAMPDATLHDSITRPRAYAKRIQEKIRTLEQTHAGEQFQILLRTGKVTAKPSYRLPATISPTATATPYERRLYEEEWSVNGFEDQAIRTICGLDNLLFWHRNPVRSGFRINGAVNHYPDFILLLRSGRVVVLETKGDDRDNSDSATKLALGHDWAAKAGEMFHYFMVFETRDLPGASRLDDFVRDLRGM
ncbi:MAG: DEAD/DEAH box helicase family protein [Magnetospirillum gryphiswaldense]|nr:DEAD/DEAH box helicase family protein [Magnetospirillum gryphiswaldense]